MSVISITISESVLQKVAGIPNSINVTTNIPSTVFYTLDGTTPTTANSIITGQLFLPSDIGSFVLSLFATDGINNSAIITKQYGSTTVGNRMPRDTISNLNQNVIGPTYPFGSQDPGMDPRYGNIGGTTVDNPELTQIPDGYDGSGGISNYTNLPLNEYSFVFSETNSIGEAGKGIGTLPAQVTVIVPQPNTPGSVPKGSNNTNSPFFNPKALVIFDDSTQPPYDPTIPRTNRSSFSLEDPTRARYGALLFTSALDGPGPRGTALKSQYNPRDNTMNYYYFDSDTNRWIISKVPFQANSADIGNYGKIVFGRTPGVFKWLPGRYRTLI
jgi:hypothetical protein